MKGKVRFTGNPILSKDAVKIIISVQKNSFCLIVGYSVYLLFNNECFWQEAIIKFQDSYLYFNILV